MSNRTALKDVLRPFRDFLLSVFGFSYDFFRYLRYGGWAKKQRLSARDFKAAKIYHRLEKSMCFREQRASSGIVAAEELVRQLKKSEKRGLPFSFHEMVGINVLREFRESSLAFGRQLPEHVLQFIDTHAPVDERGGVLSTTSEFLGLGALSDPEGFFLSRYSVRDFSSDAVLQEDILRSIELAKKSPSVCNRLAAFVYVADTREAIDRALSLQNGNRGFGHEVPCLFIVCVDISAFDTAGERYQHWIDGGMFSMSLVLALHALGYGSCCLNWSKTPGDDVKIRRLLNIEPQHTIMMMIAAGKPRNNLKVCQSLRKPTSDVVRFL